MAMRLNENLDDNGEMHEINVTPFIDVALLQIVGGDKLIIPFC